MRPPPTHLFVSTSWTEGRFRSSSCEKRRGALNGLNINGSLHVTIQTGVLIETLQALGVTVRWASCNTFLQHAASLLGACTAQFSHGRPWDTGGASSRCSRCEEWTDAISSLPTAVTRPF